MTPFFETKEIEILISLFAIYKTQGIVIFILKLIFKYNSK